jgi:hypothetical protein
MSQTRRWFEIAAALPVLAVFAALYAWAAPLGDPTQRFDAYLWLALAFAMPTMLWLLTSWLLVHHWWTGAGARLPATDAPSWLLVTALATVPEPRQHWGQAMLSELARVRGRTARWRFALSCARAVLFLPVIRGRRGLRERVPAPVASVLVTGTVAASVATTMAFVGRHPAVAEGFPPATIALLTIVLVGCLWLAVVPPRRLAGGHVRGIGSGSGSRSRLAPYLGVGAAYLFVLGLLATIHANRDGLVPLWLLYGPVLTFGVPALTAAAVGRSFRAGVRAGTWTAITVMPLTFAVLLAEASRQYAIDGEWLFAGDVTTASFTVGFALLVLVAVPVIGFPFAVIGATAGAQSPSGTLIKPGPSPPEAPFGSAGDRVPR